MRAIKINNKWCIEVYTEEFGYVLLLKKGLLEPISFNTKEEAENNMELLNKDNCELCL